MMVFKSHPSFTVNVMFSLWHSHDPKVYCAIFPNHSYSACFPISTCIYFLIFFVQYHICLILNTNIRCFPSWGHTEEELVHFKQKGSISFTERGNHWKVNSLPFVLTAWCAMLEKKSCPVQNSNPQYAWFVSSKKSRLKPLSHSLNILTGRMMHCGNSAVIKKNFDWCSTSVYPQLGKSLNLCVRSLGFIQAGIL